MLALAPMQDVTDLAFWRVMARYGGADVYWTEYFRVHADSRLERWILDSITQNPTGRPVVAQMIGNDILALCAPRASFNNIPSRPLTSTLGAQPLWFIANAPGADCCVNRNASMRFWARCERRWKSPLLSRLGLDLTQRALSTSCSGFSRIIPLTCSLSTGGRWRKCTDRASVTILSYPCGP